MGFLDDLVRGAQEVSTRAYNQVNPFDGGKNFATPVRQAARPQQRPQPARGPIQVAQARPEQLQMASQSQAPAKKKVDMIRPTFKNFEQDFQKFDTFNYADKIRLINEASKNKLIDQNQAKKMINYAVDFHSPKPTELDPISQIVDSGWTTGERIKNTAGAGLQGVKTIADFADDKLKGNKQAEANAQKNYQKMAKLLNAKDHNGAAGSFYTEKQAQFKSKDTLNDFVRPVLATAGEVTPWVAPYGQVAKFGGVVGGRVAANTGSKVAGKLAGYGTEGAIVGPSLGVSSIARQYGQTGQVDPMVVLQETLMGAGGAALTHGATDGVGAGVRGGAKLTQDAIKLHNSMTPAQRQAGFIAGPGAKGFKDAQAKGMVFDGVDGKQRFEGDDSTAKFITKQQLDKEALATPNKAIEKKLSDVLDHPELYKNYPDLKDVKVYYDAEIRDYYGAAYDAKANEITVGAGLNDQQIKEGILHELQHAIQNRENFAYGATAKSAKEKAYLHSAGEAEARAVQARMNMGMGERYVKPETLYHGTGKDFKQFGLNAETKQARADIAKLNAERNKLVDSGKIVDNALTIPPQAQKRIAQIDQEIQTIYQRPNIMPSNVKEKGVYLTSDKNYAKTFAGKDGKVLETTADLKKPYIIKNQDEMDLIEDAAYYPDIIKNLESQGYDGIKAPDGQVLVFDPAKVSIGKPKPRPTFYDSLDVPKDELIVRKGGGKAMSIEPTRLNENGSVVTPGRQFVTDAQGNTSKRKATKFADTTIQNSDEVSAATKKLVKDEGITYETTTNKERLQNADDVTAKMTDDEAANYVLKQLEDGNFDTKGQAAVDAIQVAKRLDASGTEDGIMRATEVYGQLAERLSKAGQEVQAASLLASRTPEGLRYKATKDLKNAGVKVTPEMEQQLRGMTNEVKQAQVATDKARKALDDYKAGLSGGKRTPAQQNKLDELRQNVRSADENQAIARDNVQYFVAEKIPSETADKVINFWRAGLLTSPTTTGGALVGNAASTLIRKLWVNPTATLNDMVMSAFTGKRTQTLAGFGQWSKGMKRGGKNVTTGQYWRTGYDPMNPTATADSMGSTSRVINYGGGKVDQLTGGRLGKITTGYVNGVYKVMGAADQPFRYGAYDEVMSSLAKSEAANRGLTGWKKSQFIDDFINEPPVEAVERATKEAMDSTFQNKTALAAVIQSTVGGLKQKGHHRAAAFVQFFAPFAGVPSSVADRLVRHTPIGTANTLVKEIIKVRKGGAFDQRLMAQAFAEGSIGLPIVAAGFALAKADAFNGAYPSDPKERQKWIDQGRQENSVKIGDTWYSMNYIQPFGVLLSIGAGIAQTKGEEGEEAGIGDYAKHAAASAMQSFMGQSYMEGLQGPIEAMTDPEQNADRYISGVVSSGVPNAIRAYAKATDPYQRDTKGIIDSLKGSIPFLNQTLPQKLDSTGQPIKAKTDGFNMLLNPLKPSNVRNKNDAVVNEVTRLFDANEGVVSSGMKTLSLNNKVHKLDKNQQRQYNEALGKAQHQKWAEVMQQDDYKNGTDYQKKEMLESARTEINDELKRQFLDKKSLNPSESLAKTITAPTKTSKDDTTVTSASATVNSKLASSHKDVLKKYASLDETKRKEWFNKENDAEFKYAAAKYENDKAEGKISDIQDIKRKKELAKEEVGSKFSKETRDLYQLGKADLYNYVTNSPKGEKLAQELLEYDRKLVEAGLNPYDNALKFKNGLAPQKGGKKSTGGRARTAKARTGGKSGKQAAPKMDSGNAGAIRLAALGQKKSSGGSFKKQLKVATGVRKPGITAYKKAAKTNVNVRRTA